MPQLEDSPLEESSQSEETELPPAEDETMEEVPESDVHEEAPMMFASAAYAVRLLSLWLQPAGPLRLHRLLLCRSNECAWQFR